MRSEASTASQDRCFETVGKFLGITALMGFINSAKKSKIKQLIVKRCKLVRSQQVAEGLKALDAEIEQAKQTADEQQWLVVEQKRELRHIPVCEAVADIVVMATALSARKRRVQSGSLPEATLQITFDSFRTKVQIQSHETILLTTYTVSPAARSMATSHSVIFFNASDLTDSWGKVKGVCESLGILPFAKLSQAQAEADSTEAELGAMFEY